MFSDGSAFLRRAAVFQNELKAGRFPNAGKLAELARCSKNTAQRTIDQLREKHFLPVAYDASRRGYYLTEPLFQLPELPPGKDEVTALLLMKDLAKIIAAADVHKALDALWATYAGRSGEGAKDLARLAGRFSSDLTAKASEIKSPVIELLQLADSGAFCSIDYCSPWSKKAKSFSGRINQLRYIDGMLYVILETKMGQELVLNASFIQTFEVLFNGSSVAPRPSPAKDGYGIWQNEAVVDIVLRILPPASHYYSSQIWHDSQKDSFEGEILVRKLRSALSPEIVRRVLSLGGFVKNVEPSELKKLILSAAKALVQRLETTE